MSQIDKNSIKPIYRELVGYLSEAPVPKNAYDPANQSTLWTRVNSAIDELNTITQKDYNRFKVTPHQDSNNDDSICIVDLRSALGGVTSRLHAEYFSDEDIPFGSKSGVSVYQSQNQEQHQEMYLQMVVDLTTLVSQKLKDPQLSNEERTFLGQVKAGIARAKSGLDLLNLILGVGAALGLTASQIASLLK